MTLQWHNWNIWNTVAVVGTAVIGLWFYSKVPGSFARFREWLKKEEKTKSDPGRVFLFLVILLGYFLVVPGVTLALVKAGYMLTACAVLVVVTMSLFCLGFWSRRPTP
jgi:protein-S-isoprenylcysteine O-methyltransferase Ste14